MQANTISLDGTESQPGKKVRVWDFLVRTFHWVTVIGVAVAFVAEDLRDIHKIAGYVVMGALAVRILWGFFGSPNACFRNFVPGPRKFWAYIKAMIQLRELRHLGHNPAGGAMVLALMMSLVLVSISGWMMTIDQFWGVEWVEELHEVCANGLLVLIPLHIGGVLWSSYRHRENLVKAMVTGEKSEPRNP